MAKLKKLAPGIYGTPGVFDPDFLKKLPTEYESPPGGRFKFDSKKGLKEVKKSIESLKISKKEEEEKKKKRKRKA